MVDKTFQMKEIFELAAREVEGLPEDLRPAAFEIAVKHLTGESPEYVEKFDEKSVEKSHSENNFYKILADRAGVPSNQIKSVYHLTETGEVKVVAPLPHLPVAEQQRLLLYLLLFAAQIGLREEWISASDVTRVMKEHGVLNTHLASNINLGRGRIKILGSKRGRKYSLTPSEIEVAKTQLTNIIEVS